MLTVLPPSPPDPLQETFLLDADDASYIAVAAMAAVNKIRSESKVEVVM